jgi:hypothetical protein
LLQDLLERCDVGLAFRIVRGRVHQHANATYLVGLLATRNEWPRKSSTAENPDELSPSHCFPPE